MPLNGSGTYTPPAPEFPAIANTLIKSADFNAIINDIAAALSQAIFRDGQVAFVADQSMGSFKLRDLAQGVLGTDAVNLAQMQSYVGLSSVYLGGKAADPTVRNDGSALEAGDLYFNTATLQLKTWDGATWLVWPYTDADLVSFLQAGTGATVRTVRGKLREQYVTPEDFGAIGDDVTDDHDAIQVAFDSGKAVRLVSAYYTASTLTLPENTVVFGDGKISAIRGNGNMTVLALTGTSGTRKNSLVLRDFKVRRTGGVTGSPTRNPVEITYADDCRIENLIIDGASSTYPGYLACLGTRNIKVVGCDFINGASLILSSSDGTISGGWGENNVISNCRVTGSGTVGQGFNVIYNKNVVFDNCVASGIGSTYGCGFLLEYEIQGAVLSNCVSYGNVRSGFYLEGNVAYGVKNVSLNNCIAYSNGEAGITCDANFINVAINGGAYFSNTGTFVGGSGHGMYFSGNSGVSINGALIHSNTAAGIAWVANPYKATITGNQIRDNGGYGIYFTGTPSLVDIIGNTINNNTAGAVAGWLETAGTWDGGPWVSWAPSWYKNDNSTEIGVTSQAAYYKRIGKLVHYSVFVTFSGTCDGTTYMSIPIEGGWADGVATDDTQRPRGSAHGAATTFAYVTGVYDNDRVRISPTAAGDTSLWVQGTYEIA